MSQSSSHRRSSSKVDELKTEVEERDLYRTVCHNSDTKKNSTSGMMGSEGSMGVPRGI